MVVLGAVGCLGRQAHDDHQPDSLAPQRYGRGVLYYVHRRLPGRRWLTGSTLLFLSYWFALQARRGDFKEHGEDGEDAGILVIRSEML